MVSALLKFAAAFFALSGASNAVAEQASGGRPWTAADIVAVPEVTDIRLSRDRQTALFVVRLSDVAANHMLAELRRVDLSGGASTLLFQAKSIRQIANIPGTADFSALVDFGDGVQLYRIAADGTVSPLTINTDTVLVGNADQAVMSYNNEPPQHVGILYYQWSPDGRWLWYSKLRQANASGEISFDETVTSKRDQMRSFLDASIEFWIQSPGDGDRLVATRPTRDTIAHHFGGNVSWETDHLKYQTQEVDARGGLSVRTFSWDLHISRTRKDDGQEKNRKHRTTHAVQGVTFSSEGVGPKRHLIGTYESGKRDDYGETDFVVGDPRSVGTWVSADRMLAIIGTRNLNRPHYGLALVENRKVRELETAGSFTKCDFDSNLTLGVCLRQGLSIPPELTIVRPRVATVKKLVSVSPRHDNLRQFKVTPRIWRNRKGFSATGFIVWPPDYDGSKSYPAIFVTHGSDADDRFAHGDLQWNYPVQLFAQRGYIVILMNDPAPFQNARIASAYRQWGTGAGDVPPAEMAQLIWINGAYSFEDAAREMAREGIIDINRVGIAGYSRGSQMVNVTMTQSKLFKAASSGDGGFLEPSAYRESKASYDVIFGGSPLGSNLQHYQALSPSLRASLVCGPLLMQVAAPHVPAIDFYHSLREAGIPSQISLYPGEDNSSQETHIFHIPSNRLVAMQENLAWFDFWLLGRAVDDAPNLERIANWKAMRQDWQNACSKSGRSP